MTSDAPSDHDQKRKKWSPTMDCYFIKLMLEQKAQGNRIDGQFTKRAWSQMTNQFNAKFKVHMDKDHLRNRVKTFKKQYDSIKTLLNQSGFGWDSVQQMVIADDDVWDAYIKVHTNMKQYRAKFMPYYNDLAILFGKDTTDGKYSYVIPETDVVVDGPHLTGADYIDYVLKSDIRCREDFRMDSEVFYKLCDILHSKNLLRHTKGLRIEEQLAIFLLTIGHSRRNRILQERLHHSGETISRHFNNVLDAIVSLASDFFQSAGSATPPEIANNPIFYPYFQDCVGALGTTHIAAIVPAESQAAFRNHKGFISQNVLAACSFDMRFHYVLAGWEGSAEDSLVLNSALTRADKLHVPEGKYYFVDAAYENAPSFMAPYVGFRYHLNQFADGTLPENARELFNHRHSSLRNVVKRTFEVLKARFPILKLAPPYPFFTQVKLVIAACIIHNHIHKVKKDDWLLREYEARIFPEVEDQSIQFQGLDFESALLVRDEASERRDSIAEAMWNDHVRAI